MRRAELSDVDALSSEPFGDLSPDEKGLGGSFLRRWRRCDTSLDFGNRMEERCRVEGRVILTSGLPYVPPGWGLILEAWT